MASKGYKLPDVIDPPDDICVRVTIPNDLAYRAALWGAIMQLTKWYSWERDELKRGKDAAARFQQAVDPSYEAYLSGDRCGESMMLRQSPVDPCHLEQSFDGGESWTLAFDYSLCGTVAMPPPYTDMDPTTNRLPDELQLDSYLWWWRSLLTSGIAVADAAGTVGDVKAALNAAWTDATGRGAGALFDPLAVAIAGSDTAERESVLDPTTWKDGRGLSLCRTRKHVVEPDDNRTWLDRASESIAQWLRSLSGDIARTLSYAAASVIGQPVLAYRLALAGAVESGDGAGWGWTGPTECIEPGEALPDAWEWNTGLQGWETTPQDDVVYHWQPGAIGCTTSGGWREGRWTITPPDGYTWHCQAGATVELDVLHDPGNAFLRVRVNYSHVPGLVDDSNWAASHTLPHSREIISIEIAAHVYAGTAWLDALRTTGLYQEEAAE